MAQPIDGMAEALRRIAAEAEALTGALDLSDLGLDTLPEALFALTHLRQLDLGCAEPWGEERKNRIAAQVSALTKLTALETLSVAGSDLDDLSAVSSLSRLVHLDCVDTQVANLTPLAGLAALQSLNCSVTQVADLTPLTNLTSLQSLACCFTEVADLAPLGGLAGLQSLDCSNTEVADLTPLAGLIALRTLDFRNTQVADLGPLAALIALQSLCCLNTPVADLAPLAGLVGLKRLECSGARVAVLAPLASLDNLQHLGCSHNPLGQPLRTLAAQPQPRATRNVLAWLRGTLDPGVLADATAVRTGAKPPDIPPPGAGLHVRLTPAGIVDFALPDDLDNGSNDLGRLCRLHTEITDAARTLTEALSGGNQPRGALREASEAYAEAVVRPLDAVDFTLVFARGARVRRAAAAMERRRELPLAVRAAAALGTLLDLHGPFVGASVDGVAMLAEAEIAASTAAQRAAQHKAAVAFATALRDAGGSIVAARVAMELAASAAATEDGPKPTRSSVIASAQARHVATALLGMATVAGMAGTYSAATPVPAAASAVLTDLLMVEPLKSSKGFSTGRSFLTRAIDRSGEVDPDRALASLWKHRAFVVAQADGFLGLAALGGPWTWISQQVDWIRAHRFARPRPTPPRAVGSA